MLRSVKKAKITLKKELLTFRATRAYERPRNQACKNRSVSLSRVVTARKQTSRSVVPLSLKNQPRSKNKKDDLYAYIIIQIGCKISKPV